MFEITPEDIARLDDKQLRTLLGLLCEAELRGRGYSTAHVTWGGDQDAPDGGLDVRVNLPDNCCIDGFVPNNLTGFQVKKQDMQPKAITKEMRPKGKLRPVIHDIAMKNGAYIIVSSKGTVADIALQNRKKTMVAATSDLSISPVIDFYDRTRLASWVRNHSGLIIWTRNQVGRVLPGWQPFDSWAYPSGGTQAEFLLEKGSRVKERGLQTQNSTTVEEGIERIRQIVRDGSRAIRVIGLSGVGKTRFVQALFDARIGTNSLDPAQAIYTNLGDNPDPQPFAMASNLVANKVFGILIIDNCPSDLHQRLAGLLTGQTSALRIITIEYDIQDDQPETTHVFELLASSAILIEKLLKQRFSRLSDIDIKTAAQFSGGNARIAIALADTVHITGTLASLTDTQLFKRLFVQRQDHNDELLKTAEACSLVYSFDGENVSGQEDSELTRIASLIDLPINRVYRNVAELLRRDLAQRRGAWRAILPQALANRLAERALQNIPRHLIKEMLINGAPEHLTKSFAKRLGFLGSAQEARAIVSEWLAPDGWIGADIWNLNEFGIAMLHNSLPAAPEVGLLALESNFLALDTNVPIAVCNQLLDALRSLAWEAALFERCAKLLQLIVIYGEETAAKKADAIHTSLFFIYLSGSHATADQRARVIRQLLASDSEKRRALGISALGAMLECSHFSSSYDFQFGGRSRDYGYQPTTYQDQLSWFKTALAIAVEFSSIESLTWKDVKRLVSNKFRGLWTRAGLHDDLEAVFSRFASEGFWREGWGAVRLTRFYDEKNKESPNYKRLSNLEHLLRPAGLVQRVQGIVFGSNGNFDFDEVEGNDAGRFRVAMEKRNEEIILLGSEVSKDLSSLHNLMPETLGRHGNIWYFARGLARGTREPCEIWSLMIAYFLSLPQELRDPRALSGFLFELALMNSSLSEELLDAASVTDLLAPYFVSLQASVVLTSRGIERLTASLKNGKAPIQNYKQPSLENADRPLSNAEIRQYVLAVAAAEDGVPIAIEILSDLFNNDLQYKRVHEPEIIDLATRVLYKFPFGRSCGQSSYHLANVIKRCMLNGNSLQIAREFFENLKLALKERRTRLSDQDDILRILIKYQPSASLDALLLGENAIAASRMGIYQFNLLGSNPLDEITTEHLLIWCGDDPTPRFKAAASIVTVFHLNPDGVSAQWASLAGCLVHCAPDPVAVMGTIVGRLRPMSWNGAKSAILKGGADLLDRFDTRENLRLSVFIADQRAQLQAEAAETLEWETKYDRDRDQAFE